MLIVNYFKVLYFKKKSPMKNYFITVLQFDTLSMAQKNVFPKHCCSKSQLASTACSILISFLSCTLQDYPKLSQTYYVLLECLAQDHMSFLATMEPQVFLYILSSISEGLTALGGNLNYFTGRRGSGKKGNQAKLIIFHFELHRTGSIFRFRSFPHVQ